jgi:hypothetical protein
MTRRTHGLMHPPSILGFGTDEFWSTAGAY